MFAGQQCRSKAREIATTGNRRCNLSKNLLKREALCTVSVFRRDVFESCRHFALITGYRIEAIDRPSRKEESRASEKYGRPAPPSPQPADVQFKAQCSGRAKRHKMKVAPLRRNIDLLLRPICLT